MKYEFEKANPSFGSEVEVKADLETLLNRLRFPREAPKYEPKEKEGREIFSEDEKARKEEWEERKRERINEAAKKDHDRLLKALNNFVLANHRAANWYSKASRERRRGRENFARKQIILLFVLPLAVFAISFIPSAEMGVAQLTVILSGILAAVRVRAEWIQKSFAESNFAQAASELKEKIYTFEAEWAGKAFKGWVVNAQFEEAVLDGIRDAKLIVRKQRDSYFKESAPPEVDIVASLSKTTEDIGKLLKLYGSPTYKLALKAEADKAADDLLKKKAKAQIAEGEALLEVLEDLIEEKGQLIQESDNVARKKSLERRREALQKQFDDARVLQSKKIAELTKF